MADQFGALLKGRCNTENENEAIEALQLVSKLEGIIPALETAHAFAYLEKLCPSLNHNSEIVLNCSGRGDKDVNTVAEKLRSKI